MPFRGGEANGELSGSFPKAAVSWGRRSRIVCRVPRVSTGTLVRRFKNYKMPRKFWLNVGFYLRFWSQMYLCASLTVLNIV